MIALFIYLSFDKTANFDLYGVAWWILLVNYIGENIVGVVFIM